MIGCVARVYGVDPGYGGGHVPRNGLRWRSGHEVVRKQHVREKENMGQQLQSINLATSTVELQGLITPVIVAVTATGSTDDLVLLFTGVGTTIGDVALGDWITRTDSATLGTTFAILQPGIYDCFLYVPWSAGRSVGNAITKDATVAERQTAVPEPTSPSVFGGNFKTTTTIQTTPVACSIPVTQAEIDADTNIIRAHSFDPLVAGTAPPAASYVNVNEVVFRIFRTGDING